MRVPTQQPCERGFTLVEVIVVLIIVGIMLGLVIPHMVGARRTSTKKQAVSAARDYRDAIDAFALGHAGRPPLIANSLDWPAPLDEGPISRFAPQAGAPTAPRRLMSEIPVAVADGTVKVAADPPPAGIAGIGYRRVGATGYQLRVYVKGVYYCTETNMQLTSPDLKCN